MSKISVTVQGHSFVLAPGEIVVGRDASCQLRLADLRVSRRHLRFKVTAEGATVEDLGSSNGTYVNSLPLYGPQSVYNGDVIEIGGATLRIAVDQHGRPRAARQTMELPAVDATAQAEAPAGMPNEWFPRAHSKVAVAEVPTAQYQDFSEGTNGVRERRRHARTPTEIQVIYDSEMLNLDATARDVSDGGVFVMTELLDQVGTPCVMTIELPGTRPFRANGVVRHVVTSASAQGKHPPGMGIEFTDLQSLSV
jgi:hypothetical protein